MSRSVFSSNHTMVNDGIELVYGHCNNYSAPLHTHAELMIGMVTCGEEVVTIGNKTEHLKPGAIYCCQPDQAHTGGSVRKNPYSYASLYIKQRFIRELAGGQLPDIRERFIHNPSITQAFQKLLGLLQSKADIDTKESELVDFLNSAVFKPKTDNASKTHAGHLAKRIKGYIRDHFHLPITVNDLAALTSLHPHYLNDVFKQAESITPYAYLIATRLNMAQHYLRQGARPGQVAIECGFYDQSHLNRHFLRTFGHTPAQFQASIFP